MSDEHNPMTPTPSSPFVVPSPAEWKQKERAYREHAKTALENNKQVLFNLLAAHGITTVIVSFEGYGDSGQIEDVVAQASDATIDLPDGQIEILHPAWGSAEIGQKTCTLQEAIEDMSYALLEQTHCGWEINDGAYGDFTFNVEERAIMLDYNERYAASENYTHEF
jgi:hypothetical protein